MEESSERVEAGSSGQCSDRQAVLNGDVMDESHKESHCSASDHNPPNTDNSEESKEYDDDDERTLPLRDFYPYIRCALCNGFLIDATTITECLHTFCKSCIVKHFFYSNRCPNCSIVVHQTQPLYNIRPDRQLQDIVYKMVPHLEEAERTQMCEFYKARGLAVPKPVAVTPMVPVKAPKQKKDLLPQSVFTIPPELDVSLMLEFVGAEEGIENYKPLERKYVRVSGEATVRHVELFIRRKMELNPEWQVDVVCGEHLLDRYQSLREVRNTIGESGLQDGLLVLHFGLVLP
ncbi:polycomb group RING finger protein 6 isoform X2 [Chanos chanos]|uniref:Polycomb group RING finger protein 6 n=1 Tax=Chanos chanos TaxID=29144 RepID=A0A6J2V9B7_CHACN|nr:polycomb group RING finger protein 6 isoform X2 [Chanos chanos]